MSNKIAVVVGGTGQVGRSTLSALEERGYRVVCISRFKTDSCDADSSIEFFYGDMTSLEHIERCCSDIISEHKRVDVLINVIGKNIRSQLNDITEEIWDEVVDSNLKSVFFLCRTFANSMLQTVGGSIINFSSTAGIRALPQSPHYIAAKAGVIALSEFFAKTYAPSVRVNCIAPGFILTENHLPENYTNYTDVVSRLPLRQMTTIEEIVEAILFLASSKTITGHTLVIDGGLIL